jgi:hypothetical protein
MVDRPGPNDPANPYLLQDEGQAPVVENSDRASIVIILADGTRRVVGGVEEKMLLNMATGARSLERAQLIFQSDDGRLVLNPAAEGGEVYSCGGCKRLCSHASIRFCFLCQIPTCLSCAEKEEDELGRNKYYCPKCFKIYRRKRIISWLFSLGSK